MSSSIYIQPTKKLIDVGEVGNASTGDIIYDGGVKINDSLDALYNTFGDVRLYDNGKHGQGAQILHATGYFQKLPNSYYGRGQIQIGSRHDLNTIAGTVVVQLPVPKLGESVEFINSNGSLSTNKVVFKPAAGTNIMGSTSNLEISAAYTHIKFTCVDTTVGSVKWDYVIQPMFGDFTVPVDFTKVIGKADGKVAIELFDKSFYDGVKLVISASEVKAGVKERTLSEILLMVDPEDNKVYSDEYSVIYKNTKIYSIDFEIVGSNVVARVESAKERINFSMKSIETIKTSK